MSTNTLTYTYDDLIQKSEGIKSFSREMMTRLEEITATSEELNANYQSEEARKVVEAINKVEENGEEFRDAIEKFATVIHDDIAPTYQKIEQELKEATTDTASIYN